MKEKTQRTTGNQSRVTVFAEGCTGAFPLLRRTSVKLLLGTISGILIVAVVILSLQGMYQSSTNTALDNSFQEAMQDTQDNIVLGLAILVIGGAFLVLAYLYTTIPLGSKK